MEIMFELSELHYDRSEKAYYKISLVPDTNTEMANLERIYEEAMLSKEDFDISFSRYIDGSIYFNIIFAGKQIK